MSSEIGTPLISIGNSRDEIMIVFFDGFIKNPSEGIIRTMLRNQDDWIDKYPYLETFRQYNADELYHKTMIIPQKELLMSLTDKELTEEEIEKDIDTIKRNILIENSKITTFEFSLYQLMQESYIKKVFIYKDDNFYNYEVRYIKKNFSNVLGKIEIVSGGLLTLFEEQNPTTICIPDKSFPMEFVPNTYQKEKTNGMFFICLNDIHNIIYKEENESYEYKKEFREKMLNINRNSGYVMSTMFNLPLITDAEKDFIDNEQNEIFNDKQFDEDDE